MVTSGLTCSVEISSKNLKATIKPLRTRTAGVGRTENRGSGTTTYGHRPANNGRESGIDSAMSLLEEINNNDFLSTNEEGGLVDSDEPPAAASTTPPPTEPPSPASSTSTSTSTTDKRKRSLSQQEHSAQVTDCLREMHSDDIAQQDRARAQRDDHLQLLLIDAREAREQEASLRREEAAQTSEFHRSFLGVFGQLVEAMRDRRV
ncbi:uncharacterized protein LOC130404807 [Gadus chalcogrammus]|uniref:uncharacterized protein LOC130404807 n=1 Tax=Gadus chalcogrammus TaxID=1042646 RepID=UPI0024C4D4E6|nr:uncharacterized protein LOC130404807 [Gadus chalcogrammus]